MVNTLQHVGRAIGTAPLNTVAASATTVLVASHATEARTLGKQGSVNSATVQGNSTALWWAVGTLALSTAITFTHHRQRRRRRRRCRGRHGRHRRPCHRTLTMPPRAVSEYPRVPQKAGTSTRVVRKRHDRAAGLRSRR